MLRTPPDKEKAKSIFKMVESREKFVKIAKKSITYSTIIAENYYEIIKELFTAIALADGYKTIGEKAHKELVNFIQKQGKFADAEIETIQDLRIRRNKSSYEGRPIEDIYLENKERELRRIIEKAKSLLKEKLN